MLKEERQERILALLAERRFVQVEPLGRALCVSLPTVRRDLAELAEAGRLLRRRGGAVLPPCRPEETAGAAERGGHAFLCRAGIDGPAGTDYPSGMGCPAGDKKPGAAEKAETAVGKSGMAAGTAGDGRGRDGPGTLGTGKCEAGRCGGQPLWPKAADAVRSPAGDDSGWLGVTALPLVGEPANGGAWLPGPAERSGTPSGWPEEGETVFLDEYGATLMLAGGPLPSITVVTNAPQAAAALRRAGLRVFCTGGEVLENGRLAGTGAVETVRTFRFDRAVIAAGEENGEVLGAGPEEAALYRTVWERSRWHVLLRQPPGEIRWRYRIAERDTVDTIIDGTAEEGAPREGANNV